MKVTRIATSKGLTTSKLSRIQEIARRLGALRSQISLLESAVSVSQEAHAALDNPHDFATRLLLGSEAGETKQ